MNSNAYGEENSQKIELFLNARGLGDLDFFSKSDPYVKVFFKRHPSENMMSIGRTETIMNDLNPNFAKSFTIDYIFETRQELRFEVYDEDDKKNDDLIGIVDVTLGALAGAKNQTSILTLLNKGKDMGKLIVRCEKVE
jgi:Ca2+-dependent lipid-binding protein